MSTNYHDPIIAGTDASAESVNKPMGQLDEAITTLANLGGGGGNVVLPGRWNTRHLVMNGGHLWMHGNELRYKNGAPTKSDDGVKVVTAT